MTGHSKALIACEKEERGRVREREIERVRPSTGEGH